MYLPKVFDPAAHKYRVRYAIANILRDRLANEGAFKCCFEMEDADEVVCAILRRGLKSPELRAALERSHLINFVDWLVRYPEFEELYHRASQPASLSARQHSWTSLQQGHELPRRIMPK
jgi:hypothetical protein